MSKVGQLIVLPTGEIPEAASKIHGITTGIALACGVPLHLAIADFSNLRRQAHTIVGAHGANADARACAIKYFEMNRREAAP